MQASRLQRMRSNGQAFKGWEGREGRRKYKMEAADLRIMGNKNAFFFILRSKIS